MPWPFPFPFPGAQPGGGGQQPGGGGQQPGGGGQQQGGGSAQPIDPMAAQAASIPIGQRAPTEAPGMQPLGDPFAGNFQQGQTLEQSFEMHPNKCYTVIANSQGITELDIQLQTVLPMAGAQVVAQDNQQGPNPVLGGRGQCYQYMAPVGVNAKAVLIATAGSGLAAARIYVK
ncbi:MAG: hypothetical protein JRI23_35785 [Deltaproteobacteria bacterium]|jgi:hypothetical protein|nr:hypothetical protein [Deltaproteobacteria bacterium]MBW2537702.1 hypothetical protein [Deltaproteobacteria bacterium]